MTVAQVLAHLEVEARIKPSTFQHKIYRFITNLQQCQIPLSLSQTWSCTGKVAMTSGSHWQSRGEDQTQYPSATLSPIYNENSTLSITYLILHWQGGHDFSPDISQAVAARLQRCGQHLQRGREAMVQSQVTQALQAWGVDGWGHDKHLGNKNIYTLKLVLHRIVPLCSHFVTDAVFA
jgi:hypothetical protein